MRSRAPTSSAASHFALFAAFAVCATVLVFSWPDPQDRKRAVASKVIECCEIKIANTVIVPRRRPAAEEGVREAAIVPASTR